VLIFVTKKANCEELANNLKHNDFNGKFTSLLNQFQSVGLVALSWQSAEGFKLR